MSSRPIAILQLAALYAAIGALSLYVAIPPGYTVPLFIPAGLALTALLLWGRSLWPGVLLGSLGMQVMANLHAVGSQPDPFVLMLVPLSATLQALAGTWLARRWAGWPNQMDAPRPVLIMMALVIPLSCLIGSGISVSLLALRGIIPVGEGLFNGWTWWLGDSMGCILMLPLMLALFGKPRAEWRRRRKALVLPMLLMLLTMSGLCVLIHRWENDRVQAQFNRDAGQIEHLLRKRLEMQLDAVQALQQLQGVSPAGGVEQWRRYAAPWLARFPGTQSLGWAQVVEQHERQRFEAGLPDGRRLMDSDAKGRMQLSPLRRTYLAIRFIEPLENNARALGLDLGSVPSLAATVRASIAAGAPMASPAIHLVQETAQQKGVAVYLPVFAAASEGRERALRGVIASVFRMDDLMQSALQNQARADIEVCLVDRDGAPGLRRLSGPVHCGQPGWLSGRPGLEAPLEFAGRHWQLRLRASSVYIHGLRSWLEWITFIVGVVMCGVFGGFMLIMTGHTRRVENIVGERTGELAEANRQLKEQLDATRKAEASVNYLAMHDSLTGLPNRACWLTLAAQAMEEAARREQKLAVLFLDLDEFKNVNDSLGHSVGDQLLISVAGRLRRPVPPGATLARLGGDEFVVLLPYSAREQIESLGHRLLALFHRPVMVDQHELRTTASIGVALYPDDGRDAEQLLRHADLAMYAAKAAGRDTLRYFAARMNEQAVERLTLERDLRRALQDDISQFFLHFQPQVDAQNGRIVGCEALVRWRHPQRGLMMPGDFIELAERTGLIVPLGKQVLNLACLQYEAWARRGQPLPVSVNLSLLQMERSDLAGHVRHLLTLYQVPPGGLELELTESAVMNDSEESLQRFQSLKEMGCRFAVDDFGTGHSSLARLQRYPIDRLKIDRAFVQKLPGHDGDEAVVRATLSLARDLGMEVVAEGVETQEQLEALLKMGCQLMQGYWFAKPMSAEELDVLRASNTFVLAR
ncbi:EAL domain-containing protein [uncultured Aquitalea sp.]|uniref:bifunctional diguanylate cyclase/phosphodiesterase n=1 Tax=uncultured Aquitalea sp. TaxID=540272 RepID=UPI0025DD578D|nr:EAL domain-containing protein [uncultured Aquitalea sp.]